MMNVAQHLLNDIKPLELNEAAKDILDLMEELKFSHLPVLDDNGQYLGLICDDELLEIEDEDSALRLHQRYIKPYSIPIISNISEAIKIIGEGQLSLLPVIDKEMIYRGYLAPLAILQDLGRQLTFNDSGSILVLEVPSRDYQLSQIAQIVESEDARITGVLLHSNETLDYINVTLKINQTDLGRILKSFERYSYKIVEVFHESMFDDTAAQRYESLMKYLNI